MGGGGPRGGGSTGAMEEVWGVEEEVWGVEEEVQGVEEVGGWTSRSVFSKVSFSALVPTRSSISSSRSAATSPPPLRLLIWKQKKPFLTIATLPRR